MSTALSTLYSAALTNHRHIRRLVYLVALGSVAYKVRSSMSGGGSKSKSSTMKKSDNDNESISKEVQKFDKSGKRRVEINHEFFQRLKFLLNILIPRFYCKEMGLIILHTFFLVFRTILSVYVAQLDGRLVSDLVRARGKQFLWGIVMWMGIALPATYCNSMLTYLQSKIGIAFRTRLTLFIHEKYMSNAMFYKVANLDDRIKNADQCITQDVQKFCNSLSELYSNLAKPLLDIIIYNVQLSRAVGGDPLLGASLVINFSAWVIRVLMPPFGKMVAEEQRLEGEFRFTHARLIENAEEIALMHRPKRLKPLALSQNTSSAQDRVVAVPKADEIVIPTVEKDILNNAYTALIKHVNSIYKVRIGYGMLEDFVVKYFWGACGLILCAVPVFFEKAITTGAPDSSVSVLASASPQSNSTQKGDKAGMRTQSFVTNRRLLLTSSDAFGRIMYSYKEVSELAGYTARVYELLEAFQDISQGKMKKTLVTVSKFNLGMDTATLLKQRGDVKIDKSGEAVSFRKVPIVSPNGDILVPSMNFEIKDGMHLLVIGPNGCGKSSLFRILGGLWPVYGGTLTKPDPSQIFYIPQRPYLVTGTFRDQIIYPHTFDDMLARGITDVDLDRHLEVLELLHLKDREGGYDAVKDWKEVLSGGDKQRIAMARLYYHNPKFAILDECTSSVSLEIERVMYTNATKLGITLMTVSHRPSLWQYHDYILQFDGAGGISFSHLDAKGRLGLQEEKMQLEHKLSEMPKLKARLEELQSVKLKSIADQQQYL
ncbi:hypothetical protein MP228_010639 [Amoeboaphelidium protococcarum]|nr:hypothetical protein MP228_010639 [Amoeboaphelidium protococcarum]